METLSAIASGFAVALTFQNIVFVFIGVILGTIVGMLPGIGPAAGIGLLLPLTFGLDPVGSLIMLAGIFYGSQYGNTISAVLLNTPGTGSSVMTAIDGHQMALAGRGGSALAIAAIASFTAGMVGAVMLSLLSVPFAGFALRFGPPEYFMLMLFGLTAVGALAGNSPAKGMLAVVIGLAITTIGADLQTGAQRFTFGIPALYEGIAFIIVVVGVFAFGQSLYNVERLTQGTLRPLPIRGSVWFTRDEWKRSVKPIGRGSIIGFLVGVLPGAGATIATVFAYSVERSTSKTPERFGKGAVEGVAAPEAANNAATCGSFVPLLTLGVPGSGVTAVLLGAFIMYGIMPGPRLFQNNPDVVWGLINSMYIGNLMLLILNIPLVPLFARILYMPPALLVPMILMIATAGVYGLNGSPFDLLLMLGVGVLGYFFRVASIPIAPFILACVLGGMLEQRFRQSMTLSGGDASIFLHSTITVVLFAMIVGVVALSVVLGVRRARQRAAARLSGGATG